MILKTNYGKVVIKVMYDSSIVSYMTYIVDEE